jgi:hypothetical protein
MDALTSWSADRTPQLMTQLCPPPIYTPTPSPPTGGSTRRSAKGRGDRSAVGWSTIISLDNTYRYSHWTIYMFIKYLSLFSSLLCITTDWSMNMILEIIDRNDVMHVFKYFRRHAEVFSTRPESPTLHLFPTKCTMII